MIYLKNKIEDVINASGRMTKLGVSTQSPGVLEAMQYGATHYFLMDDLYRISGETVAQLLEAKDAVIISSASAGIALSVAAILTQKNPYYLQNIPEIRAAAIPNQIIIPKGHNVDFGAPISTMIESGGGIVVEAGYANKVTVSDVEIEINEHTAALMYVKSSHCVQKDMISIEEMAVLSRKYKIPMILDCAAELDFFSFTKMGIDYVIYSGSKALLGPTSGLVLVQNSEDARWMRKNFYGVGRSMKVGKENIFGLVQAVYEYVHPCGDEAVLSNHQLEQFIDDLNQLNGVKAIKHQDESGREIYRAKVFFDATVTGISAIQIIQELESGSPQIFTRNYDALQGYISFDMRPLKSEADLKKILKRIQEVLKNA